MYLYISMKTINFVKILTVRLNTLYHLSGIQNFNGHN